MADLDFPVMLRALLAEFRRQGMPQHASKLHAYLQRHRALEAELGADDWSTSHVLEWLALMRVPPLDGIYELRLRRDGCPTCGLDRGHGAPSATTRITLPNGAKMLCNRCGAVWVAVD